MRDDLVIAKLTRFTCKEMCYLNAFNVIEQTQFYYWKLDTILLSSINGTEIPKVRIGTLLLNVNPIDRQPVRLGALLLY